MHPFKITLRKAIFLMRIIACKVTIASATSGSTSILLVVLLAAMIHPLMSGATILIPRRPTFLLTATSQFILIFLGANQLASARHFLFK
jgi:hypothetical protein